MCSHGGFWGEMFCERFEKVWLQSRRVLREVIDWIKHRNSKKQGVENGFVL